MHNRMLSNAECGANSDLFTEKTGVDFKPKKVLQACEDGATVQFLRSQLLQIILGSSDPLHKFCNCIPAYFSDSCIYSGI